MNKPNYEPLLQLPVFGVIQSDIVYVIEGIVRELEQGKFYLMSRFIDYMCRDDRILGVSNTRINGLLGAPIEFVPADDSLLAHKIAEEVEDLWDVIFPDGELAELLRWGILLSFGTAQLKWKRTEKLWIPTLNVWHPQNARWNWADLSYKMVTMNEGEVSIDGGNGQWILYTPQGYQWGWLRSTARAIIKPFLSRTYALRDWNRYSEVHGMPFRAAIVPANATPDVEKTFLRQLANIGSETVVRLPRQQGTDQLEYDVKLIEAQANSYMGFKELIEEANKQIAITLLGQYMSTEGVGGIGSQERAGDTVRTDIKKFDAQIANTIREQILKWYALFNYGNVDLAPHIRFQVEPAEDALKKAQEWNTIADAMIKMTGLGIPLDLRLMAESAGLPLTDIAQLNDDESQESSDEQPEEGIKEIKPQPQVGVEYNTK